MGSEMCIRDRVRIFVSANNIEIPMDFSPEDACSIADELKASAEKAKKLT